SYWWAQNAQRWPISKSMFELPILSCVVTPNSPAKSHVMQERPNVFISATTADLGSYRLAVRDTLLDQSVHPILQDHLEPDYQTLLDILRREINACDAVICLVGYVYGQEPKNRPAGAPRRSHY